MFIVNGATGAIGSSLVEELSKRGNQVVGIGRNANKLRKLSDSVPNFTGIQLPDAKPEFQFRAFQNSLVEIEFNPSSVQGYIHCVAQFKRFKSPLDITIHDWEESVDINLTSCFLWNQWALEIMLPNKQGSIVNVISQASRTGGFTPITPYVAAKGAITAMTKNLSNWAGEFNIRVNCVSPGYVDNEMMNQGLEDEMRKRLVASLPLKRFASNSDIAKSIVFLVSPESSYITGTILDVSGGLTNI